MADPSKLHRAVLGDASSRADGFTRNVGDRATEVDRLFGLWVHRCVSINASVFASLGYRLVAVAETPAERRALERVGIVRKLERSTRRTIIGDADVVAPSSVRKATRYRLDDAVELESHPVLDVLSNVNPWTDGYGFREAIAADLQLFAASFTFVATGEGDGTPTELWRMIPAYVRPIADPVDFVSGFEYRHGSTIEQFTTDEVVWVRRYSPVNPYRGVGELDAWGEYASAADRIAEFNRWLFERHGSPDWVVMSERPQSEAEKRAFRKRWSQLFGRLFRRKEAVAFLTGDARLERLTPTNRELEFGDSSRMVRDFVAAGFGVPKALLTPEDANRAVTREAIDQHLRLTVWPLACRVFDALNEQLLPFFGGRLVLVPDNPIRTDAATRAAERASHLASGWSVNEVRRDDGAEPIDDPNADVPMVSAGIVPLDRAVAGPPDPFAGFDLPPMDDDAPEDDDTDDDAPEDDDAPDAPDGDEDAPTGVRAVRTTQRPRSHVDVLYGDLRTGKAVTPGLDRDNPYTDERYRLLFRAMVPVLRDMRSVLGSLDVVDPDAPFDDDVLTASVRIARDAVADPLKTIVVGAAQANLNRFAPGLGLRFNDTNPLVVQAVDDASERIARTVVGSMNARTTSLLKRGIVEGRNPVDVARDIAMNDGVSKAMAQRIARTERVFASVEGVTLGWDASPSIRGKRFNLSSNPCPLCVAAARELQDRVFDPREPIFRRGDVVTPSTGTPVALDYVDLQGPPIHPNCRCDIQPVFIDE